MNPDDRRQSLNDTSSLINSVENIAKFSGKKLSSKIAELEVGVVGLGKLQIADWLHTGSIINTALFVLSLTSFTGFCNAQTKRPSTPADIYERTHSSIVVILTIDSEAKPLGQGSGFIVAKDEIVTNHHVLEGADSAIVVFADGFSTKVEGVAADSPTTDLSILSARTGNRSALQIGDELAVHQGDPVYALGAPRGLELSITSGIVSGFRRLDEQFLIQTTAPIARGSSGGPLFDRDGKVIGVTTLLLSDAPGIYFSIGAGDVSRLIRAPGLAIMPFANHANQAADEESASKPKSSAKGQPPPRSEVGQTGQLAVGGTYKGKVHNSTVNLTSNFSIVIRRDKQTIYGCMVVQRPLYGSGPLRGSLNGDGISFDVISSAFQIKFQGRATNKNISGTYSVILPASQNGYFELEQTSLEAPPTASDPGQCQADRYYEDRSRWRMLQKGMTKSDVRILLGEPLKISADGVLQYWSYSGSGILGAKVMFDEKGVWGWDEPQN